MALSQLFHAEFSHHRTKKRPLFEGWYFKLVTKDGKVVALIPGYFRVPSPEKDNSFLQIYDTFRHQSAFIRFPAASFSASIDELRIRIGDTAFDSSSISLDIDATDKNGLKW